MNLHLLNDVQQIYIHIHIYIYIWKSVIRLTSVGLAHARPNYAGPPRGLWGPRANIKSGPHTVGAGGTPPENFEILHALKCILRASQVPFCACIQYIPTFQLPSLFSGFRSKSTTYGALLRRGHVRKQRKREVKSRLTWNSAETNLLKKTDWDVNDKQERVQHCSPPPHSPPSAALILRSHPRIDRE